MNTEQLKQELKQLEGQREQAIAQINQLSGAIAMIEKLINDINEAKDNKAKVKELKEEPKKAA